MKLTVDFSKKIGKIKPMHAVGQPPFVGTDTKYFKFLSDANIPYSRLHDVGGWFGKNMFVDIPNVFRDFDADENDPASYDFAFTDLIIKDLMQHKCEPIFRLGVTIENFHKIKYYRIVPPKDFDKWSRICEHIIRHYNEGWADGFNFDIKYWEIWNEPEGFAKLEDKPMWKADFSEYLELYKVSSLHLKKCFPDIKVGGYASCGFYDLGFEKSFANAPYLMECFHNFLKYVKENKLPFDFFSWHHYRMLGAPTIEAFVGASDYVRKTLNEYGFGDVEDMCNEWNLNYALKDLGTSKSCADSAAVLCALQNSGTGMACYYDAQIGVSIYGGMFNPLTREPFCLYYGFKAFGELYTMGTQVAVDLDEKDVYAVAAEGDGQCGVLISNIGEERVLHTNLDSDMYVYIIDENNMMTKTDLNPTRFTIKNNQVAYIGK